MPNTINETGLLTQEHIDFYRLNGFVMVENVLSADELEELRQSIDEVTTSSEEKAESTDKEKGWYYRVLNQRVNTWRDHGGIAKYVMHPRFALMVKELSGASAIRLFHDHALLKMPGDPAPTPWHQDRPYWPMNEANGLSIWIALDDVNEHNGCMMLLPKSQHIRDVKGVDWTQPQEMETYSKGTASEGEKPFIARMKAGSCT